MSRISRAILILPIALGLVLQPSLSAAQGAPVNATNATNATVSKESKLKAAYLLNFIKFINWPNHSPDNPRTPLSICLQDATPFEEFFRDLASSASKANDKRTLQIYRLSEAEHCDYTYLYRPVLEDNLKLEGSVVVISSDQVLQKNAAIIFYIAERKLRFEIHLENIQALGVTVSSELLKLAKIK